MWTGRATGPRTTRESTESRGDGPARAPGSVDRGEEAAGGAVEDEASVLPGRALTESRQSLHVAPDRPGIRLVLLREGVRLAGVLLRQIESLHGGIEHRVTRRSEFLGHGPQESRLIVRGVGVEGDAHIMQR